MGEALVDAGQLEATLGYVETPDVVAKAGEQEGVVAATAAGYESGAATPLARGIGVGVVEIVRGSGSSSSSRSGDGCGRRRRRRRCRGTIVQVLLGRRHEICALQEEVGECERRAVAIPRVEVFAVEGVPLGRVMGQGEVVEGRPQRRGGFGHAPHSS